MSVTMIDLIRYEHNKFLCDMKQLNYAMDKLNEAYDFIKAKEEYKKYIYKPDFDVDKNCQYMMIKGDEFPTRKIIG